jgi:pyridoxal phosphate enzyme (YggS family)
VSSAVHEIAARLADVRARIERACIRAGRRAHEVKLLAVCKGHSADAVRAAHAAGQREFGENYVQELKTKRDALTDVPDLRFRLIGKLQRNKARLAAELAHAVDAVDSAELAAELSRRAQALDRTLEVLLQVNVDREPQKGGVPPEALPGLIDAVRALPALSLQGLMTIPRADDDPERSRPAFAALRELGRVHGLSELSMGMSADLEVAIEEGATMVRVGTAIFGARAVPVTRR